MFLPADALGRLIAKLSSAVSSDVDDVLAALPPAQQDRVRQLLALRTRGAKAAVESMVQDVTIVELPAGVSPWLRDRLQGRSTAGEGVGLTPAALKALRRAVAEVRAPDELQSSQQGARRRVRLFDRSSPSTRTS